MACYAMSGTDLWHAPMRCPVVTSGMLLADKGEGDADAPPPPPGAPDPQVPFRDQLGCFAAKSKTKTAKKPPRQTPVLILRG
eukprot:2123761-Rhodomonas_salina.1